MIELISLEYFFLSWQTISGPYLWEIYDILVLPPSFNYLGMEHPCLTFISPFILSRDKANIDVIAHEVITFLNLIFDKDMCYLKLICVFYLLLCPLLHYLSFVTQVKKESSKSKILINRDFLPFSSWRVSPVCSIFIMMNMNCLNNFTFLFQTNNYLISIPCHPFSSL